MKATMIKTDQISNTITCDGLQQNTIGFGVVNDLLIDIAKLIKDRGFEYNSIELDLTKFTYTKTIYLDDKETQDESKGIH